MPLIPSDRYFCIRLPSNLPAQLPMNVDVVITSSRTSDILAGQRANERVCLVDGNVMTLTNVSKRKDSCDAKQKHPSESIRFL